MSSGRNSLVTCVLGVALALFCVGDARGQIPAGVRRLLPPGASIFSEVKANLDTTREKEWVVRCRMSDSGEDRVMILRKTGARWTKAFDSDRCFANATWHELRDIDNDGTLEVLLWRAWKNSSGFEIVDFWDGRFRVLKGLTLAGRWGGQWYAGFFNIDGNGTLEGIIPGSVPGYLAAMFPDKRIYPPLDEWSTGERDVLIYRFVDGEPVLYFPPLSALPEGLKRGLVSGYSDTCTAAAESAGILRLSETVPRLLTLVTGPDQDVATAAVKALARIGGPWAVAGLIYALNDDRSWVVEQAANALAGLEDESAADAVLKLRYSDDPQIRCAVARMLGRRGGPEAIEALCRYLQDEDGSVRWAAAEALQDLGGGEVADALAQLLDDSRRQVRAEAARVLARLGDRRAIPVLISLVEQDDFKLPDFELLAKLGDKSVASALLRKCRLWLLEEHYIPPEAAHALCEVGDRAMLDEFVRELVSYIREHDSSQYGPAWQCLYILTQHVPSRPLLDLYIELLQCSEPLERWSAPGLLGLTKSPAAVPALIEALGYEHAAHEAATTLGKIGDPSAIPALRKTAAEGKPRLAEAAKWALIDLHAPEAVPLLIEWSRAGKNEATGRLAEMHGQEVEEELLRALRENPPYYDIDDTRWGAYDGWFKKVSLRLGEAAVPALIARLQEVAHWEEKHQGPPEGEEGCVAVAAAHCLRELGAVEAIPALLKVAASHPNRTAREVARWSLVALRRQGAKADEPLFPEIKQQPLETYLGPGGPWEVTHVAVGNLDADPEAEFAVAYREVPPEEVGMAFPKIAVLDWRHDNYVLANKIEPVTDCATSLELKDLQNDGVPEVLLRGDTGSVRHLAVYAWGKQGLRVLGSFDGGRLEPLLADLDGDDTYEVLIGGYDPNSKWWTPEEWFLSSLCVSRWNTKACKYEAVSDADAATLLGKGTKHAEVDVRKACVRGLGWTGSRQAVPALVEALGDEDWSVRHTAVDGLAHLAHIGSRKALAALRRAAKNDPDEGVRAFAQQVLEWPN